MGGAELSAGRIRNQKRRSSRKARADLRRNNELGGTILRSLFETLFTYRDGKLYWKVSTNRRIRVGDEVGCATGSQGYVEIQAQGQRYLAHRVIYTIHTGDNPAYIDHIDGDRTNNRIENLRPATNQENSFNAVRPTNNTSGVKGVSWHKASSKWRAYIHTKEGPKYLGYFTDIKAATIAINTAREMYHESFARY